MSTGISYISALLPSSSCIRNLRSSSRLTSSSVEKPGGSGKPASKGTILTRLAKVDVDRSRTDSSGSDMRPRIGTMRKRMYGKALMSSSLIISVGGQIISILY